jgi:glycerol kinase
MHEPAYVGALDQGTTSTRFLILDRSGHVLSSAQQEHTQIYPQPGWVEHNPLEILERTRTVIDLAFQRSNLLPRDIAAIGITNQRETTVVWNRHTGAPVSNAIVWQDTRTADAVARYAASEGQDRFRAKTGLPLSTYFSALKLQWILDHCADARIDAERGDLLFGNMDSFLLWHLTGGPGSGIHATDVTNASRTQLMDLHTLDWDPGLLALFGIPRAMLPVIRSSSEVYGSLAVTALAGVPIAGILGDQQAALVGQACFRPGEAKNTYGTGCFLLMNTGEARVSHHGLLTTVAYRFGAQPACYALEGSIAITGALVQWLRDNLGILERSDQIESLASSVPDNGGVYFVPAFSGLYAPYWKDSARGLIVGLTRFTTRAHIARAALEATAFQTHDVLKAMEQDAGFPLTRLRTDGGMVGNELLMQFQADILQREVLRPAMRETTALGAAYAAGLAIGFYGSLDELTANWRIDKIWTPSMPTSDRDRLSRRWKKAVERSFDWLDDELHIRS